MGRKHRRGGKTSAAAPSPASEATVSPRWRFFVWICGFFFVAGLLIRLDVITAWPGAEGYALSLALSNDYGSYLPAFLNHSLLPLGAAIDTTTDAIFLFPRLLSALCLLLTALLAYRWGGRLFGRQTMQLGLLCVAASLFLPFFGKVATPDALALLGQSGLFWLVLLSSYGGSFRRLQLLFGLFALLAAIAAPGSTVMLGAGLLLFSFLQTGMRKRWWLGGITLGVASVVWAVQGNADDELYWFSFLQVSDLLGLLFYSLLGTLPVIGWVFAGIRDLIYKVRRGEQFSMLLLGGLALSFLANSLLFPLLLAVLAGKQMQLYFGDERYPWQDFVKASAVLHLVLAFIGAFIVLTGGGIAFPGAGFRAALGMVAAYWIFSLLGVIGLYGFRRDFALGGALLAGILAVLFFWVQVYPYVEAERSWPERLLEQTEGPATLRSPDDPNLSTVLPYFRQAGWIISEEEGYELQKLPVGDTISLGGAAGISGRIVLKRQQFLLKQ